MESLVILARWELILLVSSFGAIVLWKLCQNNSLAGLMRASDGSLSPGRIQMLVLTVMTAMQYLLTTMHDPTHLPNLPTALVTALGGSQAVYLAAKAWTTFIAPNKKAKDN